MPTLDRLSANSKAGLYLNNSNEYAYTLLFGIFASVYMITASRIKINIIFHYIILICLTYLIIISGSRKVLFGEMIFISSYLIMYIYNSIRYNSLKTSNFSS